MKYEKDDDISSYRCTRYARLLSVNIRQPSDPSPPTDIVSSGSLRIRGVLRMIGRGNDTVQHDVRSGTSYSTPSVTAAASPGLSILTLSASFGIEMFVTLSCNTSLSKDQ